MNKQNIESKLKTFGLSSEEITLYLFLLENGSKTLLEASRETGINRSKIYRIVENLKKKSIIEESQDAWGRTLSASPASNLEITIVEREKELQSQKETLPDIISILNTFGNSKNTEFEVKSFKGVEGIKQMVWNELKGKELLAFGQANLNSLVGKKFAEKVRAEAVSRKQKIYELYNFDAIQNNYTQNIVYQKHHIKALKIPKNLLNIQNFIDIYNNTVNIFNWSEKNKNISGISITNKPFANFYRQIFWHYWEMQEKKQSGDTKLE